MKPLKTEQIIVENRFFWVSSLTLLIIVGISFRLWYIQIYKGDYYQNLSQRNRLRKIELPAPRGSIYDRSGKTILTNRAFFDLVYVPQYIKDSQKTLKVLSRLLNIPIQTLEARLKRGQGRPKFFPITLKKNLTTHEVSIIETNKIFLPGIEINSVPRRDYSSSPPPHLVGHLGEVSAARLKKLKESQPESDYVIGDLIGRQGLEHRWEKYLRGKRGVKIIQVDAYGRKTDTGDHETWNLPESDALSGNDIILTIDYNLQKAVEKAFLGKNGAVVAMNPKNGEILALVSYPTYDAGLFQSGISQTKWNSLINDPFKPLFDKTTGGEYQPGSIYKSVVALAALQERIITPSKTFFCNGKFELGGDVFHCHNRAGHGHVNLHDAMMKSCNVYFYNIGVELGVDKIATYARSFGLGERLGLNINNERPGLIPTSAWKKHTFKTPWRLGYTPPVAIGQGANLLTPLQMASLYATIANEGKIWKPFIVRNVVDQYGTPVYENFPQLLGEVDIIAKKHFKTLKKSLFDVVNHPDGTAKTAKSEEFEILGKTGSVQVVSLKKNRNQKDVSVKWREHAIFTAFSPKDDPEIAVAIISQNDEVGGGGRAAGPIAKEIIESFWQDRIAKKSTPPTSRRNGGSDEQL